MVRIDDNPHQPSQFLSVEEASRDVPHLNQIPPFSNKESWWFHPDRDAEGTLSFIKIITCPCHEQCDGSNSWKHAACWSFHGHLSCYSYLMHHLIQSTKHSMIENDAYDEILRCISAGKIEFELCSYTAEDRQKYREDTRHSNETEKKRKSTFSRNDEGKKARRHEDDHAIGLTQENIERIVKEAARHLGGGSGGAASSGSGICINDLPAPTQVVVVEPTPVVERQMVVMSMEKLKALQDRMVRAENAVSTAFIQCASHAGKLDTERRILTQQIEHLSHLTGEEPTIMSRKSKTILSIQTQ